MTFFNPIENFWPRTLPLSDVYLVATRFDHRPISDEEFASSGVPLPPNLQFAAHKRRAEFLAGRLCAYQALLMLNGTGYFPGTRKDRAPKWHQSCVGSITHSNTWAAALVGRQDKYLALGLDMEHCLSNCDGRKLAEGILTEAEWLRFSKAPSDHLGLIVTLAFSLKESLFKALYPLVGTLFYLEHAELVNWNIDTGIAHLRLLKNLDNDLSAGRELEAHFCQVDGHIMSLVAVQNIKPRVTSILKHFPMK